MKQLILICSLTVCIACKRGLVHQTGASANNNVQASATYEPVYPGNLYELTGVVASQPGRMFTNYSLWTQPHKYDVVEITSPTRSKPYPESGWISWRNGEAGFFKWVCVQAVYVDDKGKLWVIVDPLHLL